MSDEKLYETMVGRRPMAECRVCGCLSILAAIDGVCLGCSEGWNVSVVAVDTKEAAEQFIASIPAGEPQP